MWVMYFEFESDFKNEFKNDVWIILASAVLLSGRVSALRC
jgi:hypothetical protein